MAVCAKQSVPAQEPPHKEKGAALHKFPLRHAAREDMCTSSGGPCAWSGALPCAHSCAPCARSCAQGRDAAQGSTLCAGPCFAQGLFLVRSLVRPPGSTRVDLVRWGGVAAQGYAQAQGFWQTAIYIYIYITHIVFCFGILLMPFLML